MGNTELISNKDSDSQSYAKYKNFFNFLSKNKTIKEKMTNTSFGRPWGKYYINDEDYSTFLNLYAEIIDILDLHLTEFSNEVAPLIIDIDLKFDADTGSDRKYTDNDICYISNKFGSMLQNYYNLPNDCFDSFIFEKNKPTFNPKQNNYKDGVHIIFPFVPVCSAMRYSILSEGSSLIKNENGLSHLSTTNDIDTIIDKAVVKNCWMMYGSYKHNGKKYKLTKIINHTSLDKIPNKNIDMYTNTELVKVLSMRKFNLDSYIEPNFNNMNNETKSEYDKIKTKNNNKINPDLILQNNDKIGSNCDKDTIELAKHLVTLLHVSRSENYSSWIHICWILANISSTLFETFIEFSQQCPTKYNYDDCKKAWSHVKKNNDLNVDTLLYMVFSDLRK